MGGWCLILEGLGACGNGADYDADVMGAEFIRILRRNGQGAVKGYMLYGGSKCVTDGIEKNHKRSLGCHDKMAIPLAPFCDHRTWHQDRNGGWAEQCPNEAIFAKTSGAELVTVRCVVHVPPELERQVLPMGDAWVPLRQSVKP